MIFQSAKTPKKLLSTNLEKVITEYLEYFAVGSSHTARAKRLDLSNFVKFLRKYRRLNNEIILKTSHWDHSSVQAYLESLLDSGSAPSSVARKLATLKHFGRTLADNVVGFVNPAKEAKAPKTVLQRPKGLTQSQSQVTVDEIFSTLGQNSKFNPIRNASIFVFLLETGLRADECRLLRRIQISEDLKWIKNVRTKGRKFRNVYICSRLRSRLNYYIQRRALELKKFYPEIKPSHDGQLPLFISTYKARPNMPESFLMGAKTLWRSVNEISKKNHLHPHLLRHSFALNLLESSKDVRLVSQALGHSDVRVTMRYTQRQDEDVARAMEEMGSEKA